MWLGARLEAGLARVRARRYRRILVASGLTLATCAILLGLIGFIQWRGRQALHSDASTAIAQAGRQLVRTLQSRRGTLTLLRDTVNRQPDLTLPQLQALGRGAVQHTRHLLGVGVARPDRPPVWWHGPTGLSRADAAQLTRAILSALRRPPARRAPMTCVATTRAQRTLLVMTEPLRAPAYRGHALVGVFDVKPLLEDFATTSLSSRHPIQLLDGDTLLYRSPAWQSSTQRHHPIVVAQPVQMDAVRWLLELQPGRTRVAQTLSWLNALLIALSVIAGLGVTAIVWMLAIRAWVLQRVVARRTAALRRVSERLREMAETDELTGLHNRRFFLSRWDWEYARAKRYQRPLVCLMVDVNGFKQVNDRLGHAAGDLVLKHIAQELKTALRQSDLLARFGGDEFIVALPETSAAQAESVAEKLRRIRIAVPEGARHGVPAVSLSVGMGRVGAKDTTPQNTLEAADHSLYAWKRRAQHQS